MSIRSASEGYVALLAVLILGAISTTVAVTLLITGTDSQRSTLVSQQSAQARNLSGTCAEEALQIIHDNTLYTGSNSMTLGQGGCTYTVTNTGGNARTIDATGTVSNVVRKVKVYATINTSSISITSWQEVSDL